MLNNSWLKFWLRGVVFVIDLLVQNRHYTLDDSVYVYYVCLYEIFGHVNKDGAVSKHEVHWKTGLKGASFSKANSELVRQQGWPVQVLFCFGAASLELTRIVHYNSVCFLILEENSYEGLTLQ